MSCPSASRTALSGSLKPVFGNRNALLAGTFLFLGCLTAALFWPIIFQGFIGFDDPEYLTENPNIQAPLSWSRVIWALETGYFCSWHPITWLSYMVDYQFYGLNPAGYHFTNLMFHALNASLLFLLFHRMTGYIWRSALVAATFAWHPLRVESVAWASERKDVLSTFFFLLTLLAFVKYVKSRSRAQGRVLSIEDPVPSIQYQTSSHASPTVHWRFHYLLALILFALALMSKPMVVTLPCVLLLLDYWPLQRFQISGFKSQVSNVAGLALEKVPFFALAFAASGVTFLVQKAGGAVSSLSATPLPLRVENAFVSYSRYISKVFWPVDLSIFYPYPARWELGLVVGSVLLVLVCSALVVLQGRQHRFLVVGWFWFVGTLVPTIGLVQVGSQSIADRYTYIPSIGLSVIVAWLMAEWGARTFRAARISAYAATAVLASLICCTWLQVRFWQDGVTLFQHALNVTKGNFVACNYLGKAYGDSGQIERALMLCAESVRLAPWYSEGHYNLGTLLLEAGKLEESVSHLSLATTLDPGSARSFNNLGKALIKEGRLEQGLVCLNRAVKLKPDWADAHYNLGTGLLAGSSFADAASEISECLRLDPENSRAHMNLAIALTRQSKGSEALEHFARAAKIVPDDPAARFNLGMALLDQDQPIEASVELAGALKLAPTNAKTHYWLAESFVRSHRCDEAIFHFREALRLTPDYPEAREQLAALQARESMTP